MSSVFMYMYSVLLSYNRLTSLPSQLGNLSGLVSLLLQHNQLKNLVGNIGQLNKLEELVILNVFFLQIEFGINNY